jgi:hypothetical protein
MGSSSDQFLDYRKWRGNGIDQSVVFHVVTIYKVRFDADKADSENLKGWVVQPQT